jgi:hypothetical protein
MPSAISFDGTATPPILGGDYATARLGLQIETERHYRKIKKITLSE